MDEEDAFLRKLLEQPSNDLTRLVYADWLDERQTAESILKAEFLRAIADAEVAEQLTDRAKQLASQLDPNWLAVVSKLPLENCPVVRRVQMTARADVQFEYECPKRWEDLTATERTGERFCTACQSTVYYCGTIREAKMHALSNHCITVDQAIPREAGDLRPSLMRRMLGRPTRDSYIQLIQQEPVDPVSAARERALQDDARAPRRGRRQRGRRQTRKYRADGPDE